MRRSLVKYLEVRLAIEAGESFTANNELVDYQADPMRQAAVERKVTIIGEAFAQMEQHFPGSETRIEDVREIVAFRNRLIHAYGSITPRVVFAVIRGSMLTLKVQVNEWIDELDTDEVPYSA